MWNLKNYYYLLLLLFLITQYYLFRSNWPTPGVEQSRMNQRAIKTNCALCNSNLLAYKLSSENNLRWITELLKQILLFFFSSMHFSTATLLNSASSSVSAVPPLPAVARKALPRSIFALLSCLPAGCGDPGDPEGHVLRMAVPRSTSIHEWPGEAKHSLPSQHHSHIGLSIGKNKYPFCEVPGTWWNSPLMKQRMSPCHPDPCVFAGWLCWQYLL